MATQTLQIIGSYAAGVGIEFQRINRRYGSGYDQNDLTGHTDGTLVLKLNYEFLPDDGSLTVTDPENGDAVTNWSVYLWKFFVNRMQDDEAFNVTVIDPSVGGSTTLTQLFKFVDSRMDYSWFSYKLYSTGLELRQWRALA